MNAVERLGKATTRLGRDRKALRGKAEAGAPMSWAELRVHRTIDAQLAILRFGIERAEYLVLPDELDECPDVANAIELADAILGGES